MPEPKVARRKMSSPKMSKGRNFCNLPLELRIMIWQYVMAPRIVDFPAANETPFPIFGINKESRAISISHYRRMFGFICRVEDHRIEDHHLHPWEPVTAAPEVDVKYHGVIFDPAVDTLNLNIFLENFATFGSDDLKELRYVALKDGHIQINIHRTTHIKSYFFDELCLFKNCPKLERLRLYLDDVKPSLGEEVMNGAERYRNIVDFFLRTYYSRQFGSPPLDEEETSLSLRLGDSNTRLKPWYFRRYRVYVDEEGMGDGRSTKFARTKRNKGKNRWKWRWTFEQKIDYQGERPRPVNRRHAQRNLPIPRLPIISPTDQFRIQARDRVLKAASSSEEGRRWMNSVRVMFESELKAESGAF